MEPPEIVYRVMLGSLMAIGFAMGAWFRGRADRLGGRVCRREDGPLMSLLLLGSGAMAVGGLILYVVEPTAMQWSQLPVPAWVRLLGLPAGLAALGLFYWVFRALGTNVTPTGQVREHHTMVTHGPYRLVRHPMYASSVVLFAAYFLLTASWFIAVACWATFAIVAARTPREEANLAERFGDAYLRYARQTPRFIPRRRPGTRTAQNGSWSITRSPSER